ncbi:STAS domain-containing protein [Bacillus salacetis]|uniref:STAS domain-containing protein n=1 Tax=Bacillus salacetis TaxID=2315464 RepID=A0A3A1R5P6_9BACI|nr:STAS domain-containing protein [Bacillus salacetis]RIW38469.1 STAS domain-containing protein [Bacillus salacetis]
MRLNQQLHEFFLNNTREMSEEWYQSIDKTITSGVYTTTDQDSIDLLREQNHEFYVHMANLFVEEKDVFFDKFNKWIHKIANDSAHIDTPIHNVIREFLRVRDQYFSYITRFAREIDEEVDQQRIDRWKGQIQNVIDYVVLQFVEGTHNASLKQLKAQQEMINELSSPVISISSDTALLPLVGDIDTARAKVILENTLQECTDKGVDRLFIDLSGVVIIDTMVAHEIFQLIDALSLIGVSATLSGIRPEIAVTAVQLGIPLDRISIESTLSNSIAKSVGSLSNKK